MIITNAVLDIARNCYLFYGTYEACAELEFSSNNYLMVDVIKPRKCY